MEVKKNKCLKKKGVVLNCQCLREGPQDKAEEWLLGLAAPTTVSVELFGQKPFNSGLENK